MTPAFARRGLTEGEKALARRVFGDALALDEIRLIAAPAWLKRAFVPGRWFGRDWIVWPRRAWSADFSAEPLNPRAGLVHELVHVWQAQQGVNLALAKLKAGDGPKAYGYQPDDGCRWETLNIEQQAMAVEHAYRLSEGGRAPADAAFYRRLAPLPCGLEGSKQGPTEDKQ